MWGSVSRDDVIWAYRYILGREPESEKAIRAHQGNSWRKLCEIFLSSGEFQNKKHSNGASHNALEVGRFLDVGSIPVEVDCSPKQRHAMYDRIAGEWKKFGDSEPHWSVLTDPIYRRKNIDAEKIKQFYESGSPDIERVLNSLRRSGVNTANLSRALDFGCGVGRLSIALAEHVEKVIGIDLSPGHLAEACKAAKKSSANNIEFIQINSIDDLDRFCDFDLVISLIVLQHNPPPVMAAIYRKLLKSLAVGGAAVIQIPTYIHNQRFDIDEYLRSETISMEMNTLPQWKIFEIISQMGCRPIEVREDNLTGMRNGLSHTFSVIKETL